MSLHLGERDLANSFAWAKRWVLLIVGLVVVSFLSLAALWLLPDWLTKDPRVPSERYKAAADARTGVVAFLAVLGGLGGLYYTSRTFEITRKAQVANQSHANETSRLNAETLRL